MIREQILISVAPVASELPQLAPKANTMMAEAVGSLRGPMGYLGSETKGPDLSEYSREVDRLYEDQNDIMLDTIAKTASEIMQSTMSLARSVVNPAIKDAAQKAQAMVNGRAEEYATDTVMINAVPKADVWRSQTLYQATEPYVEVAVDDFVVKGLYDTQEEIPVSLLVESIPSASIASEINDMLGMDEDANKNLAIVFNRVFAFRDVGKANFSDVLSDVFTGQTKKDAMLLSWAFAKALLSPNSKLAKTIMPSEGVDPLAVGEYLSTVVEQTSNRIINAIYTDMREEKRGRVRVHYSTRSLGATNKQIRVATVEMNAYQKWLENGGKAEMVLGSLLSKKLDTLQDILDNGAELEAVYNRYNATTRQTRNLDELAVIRECLIHACLDAIQEMDPDNLTEDMAVYAHRLKEVANQIKTDCMREYIKNARCMICYAAFAHTEVEDFLCAMDEIALDNGSLSPREAARLAVERVLSCWLADQIYATENQASEDNAWLNNQCVLSVMGELVVRTMDAIPGNDIADSVDGAMPTLQARADMAMAAVRNELQKCIQ